MFKLQNNNLFVSHSIIAELFDELGNLSPIIKPLKTYLYINGFISCSISNIDKRLSAQKLINKAFHFDNDPTYIYVAIARFEKDIIPNDYYANGIFEICKNNSNSFNFKGIELKQIDGSRLNNESTCYLNQFIYPALFAEFTNIIDKNKPSTDLPEMWYGQEYILYKDILNALSYGEHQNYSENYITFYYSLDEVLKLTELYGIKIDKIKSSIPHSFKEYLTDNDEPNNTKKSNDRLMSNIINHLQRLNNHNPQTEFILDILISMQNQNYDLFHGLETNSKSIAPRFKMYAKENLNNITLLSKVSGEKYYYQNEELEIKNVHRSLRHQINNAMKKYKNQQG